MDETYRDLVCGMTVDAKTARHTSVYGDETYYFCSANCKGAFDNKPEKYLRS
ncbi:MAG: YHS domain-containing protein [Candidatus Geothermarchaeales archaeon]